MDDYLLEQQEQLKLYRASFIEGIVCALLIVLGVYIATAIIPWLFWSMASKQSDWDQWITTEIVFEEIEYAPRKLGGVYYICDQNGDKYLSRVADDKNLRLEKQLIKGKTYTIITNKEGVKRIFLLKDDFQHYITLQEGTEVDYEDKIIASKAMLLYLCFVLFTVISVFICSSYTLKSDLQRMKLYKRRIICYKSNAPLPEEPFSPIIEYEKLLRDTKKRGEQLNLNSENAELLLSRDLQNARESYHHTELFKRSLWVLLLGTVILYTCLSWLLMANLQREAEWQSKEIVFSKIIPEESSLGVSNVYLYDQAGVRYKLLPNIEYQYYYLKQQLIVGETYQITYGSNRVLFRNQNYLYQLTSDSATYIDQEEAKEVFADYKNLSITFPMVLPFSIVLILIIISLRNRLKKKSSAEKEAIMYYECLYRDANNEHQENIAVDNDHHENTVVKKDHNNVIVKLLIILVVLMPILIILFFAYGNSDDDFDYAAFVQGNLDCYYHEVYDEEFVNSLYDGSTVESLMQDHEEYLDAAAADYLESMGVSEPAPATREAVRQMIRNVDAALKYEVGEATESGDRYKIKVIAYPLLTNTQIKNDKNGTIENAISDKVSSSMSEEEYNEIYVNELCRQMTDALQNPVYGTPQTIVLTYDEVCIIDNEKQYGIVESGLGWLENVLYGL